MIRLDLVHRDYEEDLEHIVTHAHAKKRSLLEQGRRISIEQVNAYRNAAPANRSFQSRLNRECAAAYLSCWEQPTTRVREIKAHLIEALPIDHRSRCPYCTFQRELTQFDHVLEKAKAPELAFYYGNLVPSCDRCNGIRANTYDEAGRQCVIHFYDDDLRAIPDVLRARLELTQGVPAATFYLLDPLPPGAELYARHFNALRLATRYRLWAADEIRDICFELVDYGVTDLVSALTNRSQRALHRYGANEPSVALCHAMLARIDIVKSLLELR